MTGLLVLGALICQQPLPARAVNLTVNQPTNGQTFTGNDFQVSGAAQPGASIVIIRNGLTIKQTRADNSGNWSVSLQGLPDGDNNITVRSALNSGFGYFITYENDVASINQLRLTDNAINTSQTFPITMSVAKLILNPSPDGTKMYAIGGTTGPPRLFDLSAPDDPVPASGYSSGAAPNPGAFNSSGTKYFSVNLNTNVVNIIDTGTNAVTGAISLSHTLISAWRGVNGSIYATGSGNKISIINPQTDSVAKEVPLSCGATDAIIPSITFSQDAAYPYYYVFCPSNTNTTSKIFKLRLDDDTLVNTFTINNYLATSGAMNADNSKLYLTSSAGLGQNPFASTIPVLNTETGAIEKNLTLAAGAVGVFPSPDLQHLYAATPSSDFSQTGIDIIDMFTDEVSHIDTSGPVMAVTAPGSSTTITDASVSVVLGVKTAADSGQLAKTGLVIALATPAGMFLLFAAAYTYTDYRKHRAPLLEADSNAQYNYLHHLKVVTVPLVKYRLSLSITRNVPGQSGKISRF